MRSREISGFTLFWSDSKYDNGRDPPKVPGWQMNVRRKGEQGWDCKQITEEQAAAILSMLETSGHPDGPWTVKQREVWASLDGPARAIEIQASKYGNRSWQSVLFGIDYERWLAEQSGISESIEPGHFSAMISDWKVALVENTEARNVAG